jgi:hypothetical protein
VTAQEADSDDGRECREGVSYEVSLRCRCNVTCSHLIVLLLRKSLLYQYDIQKDLLLKFLVVRLLLQFNTGSKVQSEFKVISAQFVVVGMLCSLRFK